MVLRYYSKIKIDLETLIQNIRIYSQDVGMAFGIRKFDIFLMKKGEREPTEGIDLPYQKSIRCRPMLVTVPKYAECNTMASSRTLIDITLLQIQGNSVISDTKVFHSDPTFF